MHVCPSQHWPTGTARVVGAKPNGISLRSASSALVTSVLCGGLLRFSRIMLNSPSAQSETSYRIVAKYAVSPAGRRAIGGGSNGPTAPATAQSVGLIGARPNGTPVNVGEESHWAVRTAHQHCVIQRAATDSLRLAASVSVAVQETQNEQISPLCRLCSPRFFPVLRCAAFASHEQLNRFTSQPERTCNSPALDSHRCQWFD